MNALEEPQQENNIDQIPKEPYKHEELATQIHALLLAHFGRPLSVENGELYDELNPLMSRVNMDLLDRELISKLAHREPITNFEKSLDGEKILKRLKDALDLKASFSRAIEELNDLIYPIFCLVFPDPDFIIKILPRILNSQQVNLFIRYLYTPLYAPSSQEYRQLPDFSQEDVDGIEEIIRIMNEEAAQAIFSDIKRRSPTVEQITSAMGKGGYNNIEIPKTKAAAGLARIPIFVNINGKEPNPNVFIRDLIRDSGDMSEFEQFCSNRDKAVVEDRTTKRGETVWIPREANQHEIVELIQQLIKYGFYELACEYMNTHDFSAHKKETLLQLIRRKIDDFWLAEFAWRMSRKTR